MKSGIVMHELLLKELVCAVCGGRIPSQAISLDHVKRVQDGGKATVENAQITHPYCNTGIKESDHHRATRKGQESIRDKSSIHSTIDS